MRTRKIILGDCCCDARSAVMVIYSYIKEIEDRMHIKRSKKGFTLAELLIVVAIIGVLVALTNIIVEVIKKLTWDKVPTNIVATLVAEALALVSFFTWTSINSITVVWYYVVAAIVVGIMVAYAAMFGFDKLKALVNQWTGILAIKAKEAEKDV